MRRARRREFPSRGPQSHRGAPLPPTNTRDQKTCLPLLSVATGSAAKTGSWPHGSGFQAACKSTRIAAGHRPAPGPVTIDPRVRGNDYAWPGPSALGPSNRYG
jgi:hypothetical protein